MALTGFLVNSSCAPTSADAIRLLLADYPQIIGTLFVNAPSATFTAPSTFAVTFKTTAINAATTTTGAKSIVLPMCDPALPVAVGMTPFDPVVAAAFWMWALTMVLGCWLLAHNAGTIVNFINKIRG